MLTDDEMNAFLGYLWVVGGKGFGSIDDIMAMGTEGFLNLTQKIPDEALPIVISAFKRSRRGQEFFHKLTGDLDAASAARAKAFLQRYMNIILEQEDSKAILNALIAYLPPHCFDDLAFIQSRQAFFLRQSIDTINEFLQISCECTETFAPGRQEEAWLWFWNHVLTK
jgi:hypothetical protein